VREPLHLRARDRVPERAEPVIAPPLVVGAARRPFVELLDQSLVEQPAERAVERAGYSWWQRCDEWRYGWIGDAFSGW
jgi:hypothetical protein